MVLLPLHNNLIGKLKSMPTDCTYKQNNLGHYLKKKTSSGQWTGSIDCSSFTDRFPIEYQKTVMQKIYGSEIADLWVQILTKRVFNSKVGNVT